MQEVKKQQKFPLIAEIAENLQLSDDTYLISLNCRRAAQKALPGQFISILCENLILRRPFSIANVNNDTVQIIYKIKGEGTQYISRLKTGNNLNIIGPLGKGFNITPVNSLLIGGGVGIAPVMYLSKVLEKKCIPYHLLVGFRSMIDIPELNKSKTSIVTENSSSKLSGIINNHLEEFINKHKPEKIYACGPEPVLKFIVDMANKYNLEVEVALEKKFACGIGACMGCAIQVTENNEIKNRQICKDGPVFDGKSVVW